MSARMLCFYLLLSVSHLSYSLNAEQANRQIQIQQPQLLGDGSQLVSLYYFGESENVSVVGLERIGDDYLPIRWLLVFEGEVLLGWYYPCDEFPQRFINGQLIFPKASGIANMQMVPKPAEVIMINQHEIPFTPRPNIAN